MNVLDFVENFVGHHSIVRLFKVTYNVRSENHYDDYKLLWEGQDFQITNNKDDIRYCKIHGIQLCPYMESKVVKVARVNLKEEDKYLSDIVDLVIDWEYNNLKDKISSWEFCNRECPEGKRQLEKILDESERVFDAVYDMRDFVNECSKNCNSYKVENYFQEI